MKLYHPEIEYQIELNENTITTLVIESPPFLGKFLQELTSQSQGDEGNFILSDDNGKELSISKNLTVIIDYFSLDFNQKKIQNSLLSKVKERISSEDYVLDNANLQNILLQYFDKLAQEFDYPVDYEEAIDTSSLLKLAGFHINVESMSFLERLIDYLTLLQEICDIKLFCFYSLKAFLTQEDYSLFVAHCLQHKIRILLIENNIGTNKDTHEKICIIDKDLCEIIPNEIDSENGRC
ncbi:MAG: type II-A CRISPR-associated protein Csn2 [Sphaerochaetaceae bacterium]